MRGSVESERGLQSTIQVKIMIKQINIYISIWTFGFCLKSVIFMGEIKQIVYVCEEVQRKMNRHKDILRFSSLCDETTSIWKFFWRPLVWSTIKSFTFNQKIEIWNVEFIFLCTTSCQYISSQMDFKSQS